MWCHNGEFASNTPIGEKINKIERQICDGKLRLLDNDGNPLVPTGIVESDSEVEVVFDETANLRISTSGKDGSDKGGTNSLLEQWRDSYPNNDDYDPYDDDMYENHDLSEHLQSICDDLDIMLREIVFVTITSWKRPLDNLSIETTVIKESANILVTSRRNFCGADASAVLESDLYEVGGEARYTFQCSMALFNK
ncbi:hypothetical protein Tco_0866543 [Tanacetum coccineum]